MFFKYHWLSLLLVVLLTTDVLRAEKKWSWGEDDTNEPSKPKASAASRNAPEARKIDAQPNKQTQGRTFKFFEKLACKFGKHCQEEYPVYPGPIPIIPSHPVGPHVVRPLPIGPGPIVGPPFLQGPGPIVGSPHLSGPIVRPPHFSGPIVGPSHLSGPVVGPPHLSGSRPFVGSSHVNVPKPVAILPPGTSNVRPLHGGNHHIQPYPSLPNKGYPPLKPTKNEVHHHVHTHIHEGQGTGHVSPFKNTGYPPKKTGFSPLIPSSGSHNIGPRPISNNIGLGTFHAKPIVKPEIITNTFHQPSVSLYPEECSCYYAYQCPSSDIIRKSGRLGKQGKDISYLIHPRSEGQEVLSNNTKLSNNNKVVYREKRDSDITNRLPKSSLPQSPKGRALGGHLPGLNGCGPEYVCCRNTINNRVPHNTCGKSFKSSAIHGRVANTDYDRGSTQFGQYPWQGAILRDEQHQSVFVCGATLISAQHVLTAAHCIVEDSPYNLKVRLGDWDVNAEAEFYKHIELSVQKFDIHPDFYSANLNNDIAIITLQSYVDFHSNPHISPICLPDRYADFTSQHCYVTGWGKDAFGHVGQFQQILKEVDVPIVDRYSCERALQVAKLGPDYHLPEGFICAGGQQGKDTCKGDGGGPLVCPTSYNTYELAGIVSWGIECGIEGVPGVYVNIPYYVDWIKSYIGAF